MATRAYLKKLRKKFKLGEFAPKKRGKLSKSKSRSKTPAKKFKSKMSRSQWRKWEPNRAKRKVLKHYEKLGIPDLAGPGLQ